AERLERLDAAELERLPIGAPAPLVAEVVELVEGGAGEVAVGVAGLRALLVPREVRPGLREELVGRPVGVPPSPEEGAGGDEAGGEGGRPAAPGAHRPPAPRESQGRDRGARSKW